MFEIAGHFFRIGFIIIFIASLYTLLKVSKKIGLPVWKEYLSKRDISILKEKVSSDKIQSQFKYVKTVAYVGYFSFFLGILIFLYAKINSPN